MKLRILALVLGGFCFFGAFSAQASGLAVIVNAANTATADKAKIKAYFLGTARRWPDGSSVKTVDLPEAHPVRNRFYEGLLGKNEFDMKMYWSTTIFTGAGIPPKSLAEEKEVVKFVKENPGAIGYVGTDVKDDGVRVLLSL